MSTAASTFVDPLRELLERAKAGEVIECGFVGCERPALFLLLSKYGRIPWRGCMVHAPGMHNALTIGQPTDSAEVRQVRIGAAS